MNVEYHKRIKTVELVLFVQLACLLQHRDENKENFVAKTTRIQYYS